MTGAPWESKKVNKQIIESHNTTITIHLTNKSNMHHIFWLLQLVYPGSNYMSMSCEYLWTKHIEKRGKDTKDQREEEQRSTSNMDQHSTSNIDQHSTLNFNNINNGTHYNEILLTHTHKSTQGDRSVPISSSSFLSTRYTWAIST